MSLPLMIVPLLFIGATMGLMIGTGFGCVVVVVVVGFVFIVGLGVTGVIVVGVSVSAAKKVVGAEDVATLSGTETIGLLVGGFVGSVSGTDRMVGDRSGAFDVGVVSTTGTATGASVKVVDDTTGDFCFPSAFLLLLLLTLVLGLDDGVLVVVV